VKKELFIRPRTLFGLLVVMIAGAAAIEISGRHLEQARRGTSDNNPLEGLRAFGKVPNFSLTERGGRRFALSDLKGKIWIANFIYTHCPDTCPLQSVQMKDLQTEFASEKDVRFVSITVDPKRDTPEVLSKYADRFGADPECWFFPTGEKQAIHKLPQEGFRLAAAEIPDQTRPPSGSTHTHSPRFVLIDRDSEIRGYFTSTDARALTRLRRDLRTLVGTR
jgi:cytochrome oxidase Cu insertion factor (SCO1/SenC/PrrC family)